MTTVNPCLEKNVGRLRVFWTTQKVCSHYFLCGSECAIPGLEYEDHPELDLEPSPTGTPPGYRTIKSDEWLRSLILNILNTRARTDLRCPAPAAVFGHWSESYRTDNLWIGSRLYNAAEKSYTKTLDAVNAIKAAIAADMSKLVSLQVSDKVDVQAEYAGRNSVNVTITATKVNQSTILNISGVYAVSISPSGVGGWVWQ